MGPDPEAPKAVTVSAEVMHARLCNRRSNRASNIDDCCSSVVHRLIFCYSPSLVSNAYFQVKSLRLEAGTILEGTESRWIQVDEA